MSEERCELCRFWQWKSIHEEGTVDEWRDGTCRRNPPVYVESIEGWQFPEIDHDGWCGEFQAKVQKKDGLDRPITKVGFSCPVRIGFRRATKKSDPTLRDVVEISAEEYLAQRGVGEVTYQQAKEQLALLGLAFKEPSP